MATAVVMPKQGQSVESCIIVEWKKSVGDIVAAGDALCDVETDKATMEVESPIAGVLLAQLFPAGADVPVMTNIAVVGQAGEDVGAWLAPINAPDAAPAVQPMKVAAPEPVKAVAAPLSAPVGVSPRARGLAERKGVAATALVGSGPGGRVIERDVAAAVSRPKLTPVAKAMLAGGEFIAPEQGSGPGGRVTSKDLALAAAPLPVEAPPISAPQPPTAPQPIVQVAVEEVVEIPVKGVRKVIAERMLASLQTTAQLTLNASADARMLLALRKRFKDSPEHLGLRGITINDLVLFATARSLTQHWGLNATFSDNTIRQYKRVHLGVAVDTPRGLLVPVVRNADTLTLRQLSAEAKRLATACLENRITPDELSGGTFTVTNLGGFGIESFTPVLNAPQVAILGVGGVNLKPVEVDGAVQFIPHIGFSLTINHQVVDGAPAARFLQMLGQAIGQIDLLMAG
jgi:pyruvate dehydrogenase E2 component (dihydrolipoamide acetyltransferase)